MFDQLEDSGKRRRPRPIVKGPYIGLPHPESDMSHFWIHVDTFVSAKKSAQGATVTFCNGRGEQQVETASSPRQINWTAESLDQERRPVPLDDLPEAQTWLTEPAAEGRMVAVNHFQQVEHALAFVKRLYALGAESVRVGELQTEPRLNHTHAEVLYVIVPSAIEQSAELLGFLVEVAGMGCVMAPCYETQIFELWWD
jgi:hypothetical protein